MMNKKLVWLKKFKMIFFFNIKMITYWIDSDLTIRIRNLDHEILITSYKVNQNKLWNLILNQTNIEKWLKKSIKKSVHYRIIYFGLFWFICRLNFGFFFKKSIAGCTGSLELLVYLVGPSSLSESIAYPSLAFFQPGQDTRLPKSQFILSC